MGDRQPSQQALIAAPTSIPPGSKPWSPGLGRLLTEGEDGRSAVRLIAINRTLRAEAERMLPMIVRCAERAEPEEIMRILVREAPAYGVTAKSAAEWSALFESYLTALDGLPALAIEDAFVRWNRGEGMRDIGMAGWYPKAPQLYMLAETTKRELHMAAYRARRALEYVEEKGLDWTEDRKKAERQKAIDAGYLNADGTFNFTPKTKGFHHLVDHPSISPQQMAANLRASAGTPKDDDPGDVI